MSSFFLRIASAFLLFCPLTYSQVADSAGERVRYEHDSGWHRNASQAATVVLSFMVVLDDVSWMRLYFEEVTLSGNPSDGSGAFLRLTALEDGAVQELNAVHLEQWRESSAYFNGDTVLVEVVAPARSGWNRVAMSALEVGAPPSLDRSLCGPDNRVLSFDARVARVLPTVCTSWILDDCNKCMLTAGHCAAGTNVAEFNVPLSDANGSLNHPSPDHQYAVDLTSMQLQNGPIGFDWAYFGCFPNSNTGLTPGQAQGAAFAIAPPPAVGSGVQIRITGHGSDDSPLTHHKVQQTSLGPLTAVSSAAVYYRTDSASGSSGSPIINEGTGVVVGVHTNGGCSSVGGGSNSGTSFQNLNLAQALAAPRGVCSCSPPIGTSYCPSGASGSHLKALGSTSVAANDLHLYADSVPLDQFGIFYYGDAQVQLPFGNGFRCVAGQTVLRLTPATNSGIAGVLFREVDLTNPPSAAGQITAGSTWNFQAWFRDGVSFDLSDGLQIVFTP